MTERGSLAPLIAGLLALAGVFSVAVMDSANLALSRTRLQSVADGAALAAAESFDPLQAVFSGTSVSVVLTNSDVLAAARRFVLDSAIRGVTVRSASAPDAKTAVVVVTQTWAPPISSSVMPLSIRLTATAQARTVVR